MLKINLETLFKLLNVAKSKYIIINYLDPAITKQLVDLGYNVIRPDSPKIKRSGKCAYIVNEPDSEKIMEMIDKDFVYVFIYDHSKEKKKILKSHIEDFDEDIIIVM